MRTTKVRKLGFSLMEVATAVAIVAVTLVVLLGLLSGLAQRAAETQDRHVAVGLSDAITVELRRLAATRGWEALVAEATATSEGAGGIGLVAARDGAGLREWTANESPVRDQYFLVEAQRVTGGTLAVPSESVVLPLIVTVSWPFRPGMSAGVAAEVPSSERHHLRFSVAVCR